MYCCVQSTEKDASKVPYNPFDLTKTAQQQVLFDNTAHAMGDAPEAIKRRHIANCSKADLAYGAGVAEALKLAG